MFLVIQRLDNGIQYLGSTTCNYVSTCFVTRSILELDCTNTTWTTTTNGGFQITGINTQQFVGRIETQPNPLPSNTTLPKTTLVIPVVDDDFNWRLIALDTTGNYSSYISDAVPPNGEDANTTLGQLTVELNGNYPEAFLTIQRFDKGKYYIGTTSCNYIDTCFLTHSVIEISCTPLNWTLTTVSNTLNFTSKANTQPFIGCTYYIVTPITANATKLTSTSYTIPTVDDDFNWRLMIIDFSGQYTSLISAGVVPTGTFSNTPLGQLSIYLNGQFPQLFLTFLRIYQGNTYTASTTCNYVSTCDLADSTLELNCGAITTWTPMTPQQAGLPFFISANNTQPFIGCVQQLLSTTNSLSTTQAAPTSAPVVNFVSRISAGNIQWLAFFGILCMQIFF